MAGRVRPGDPQDQHRHAEHRPLGKLDPDDGPVMIPDQRLSTTTLTAPFLHPDGLVTSPLKDYELGGRALNDPSEGLQVQVWTCYVDGDDIMIQAGDSAPEVLFTAAGTTEVALAFDQNMRPAVAFTQSG